MPGVKVFVGPRTRAAIRLIRALSEAKGIAMALSPSLVEQINRMQVSLSKEWDKEEVLSLDNIGAVATISFAKRGSQVLNESWPDATKNIASTGAMEELKKIRSEFISIAQAATAACESIDESRRMRVS